MSYLPFILILIGYIVLVATTGWWGLALGVIHIAVMLLASTFGRPKRALPPQPPT